MRAWRWAVPATLAAGVLLAGCDTIIAGSATPAPGPPAPRHTTLACSGGTVVAPKGAPYCYLLPAGFTDATGQLTLNYQSANPSQFDSAVAVAVHDVIIVAVYPLRENSDDISSTVLSQQVDAVLGQGESSGFTVTGNPTPTTVDGARAFEIPIKQNNGQYGSTIYFVFRGFTEVEINCQFAAQQSKIDTGCAGVRGSIQIIDPPH
jgi:hypothetical protein